MGEIPSPAAGEVAELVQWLRQRFPCVAHIPGSDYHLANRIADLLEQRQAVSEPKCERNWDSILSPSGGYEVAEDAGLREGSQLVGGEWWAPVFGCDSLESALNRIRERLERRQPPAATGEVAELVRELRLDAEFERSDGLPQAAARFTRAADLLERLASPPGDGPSDEEVLRLAAVASHIDDINDAHEEGYPVEVTTTDLLEIARALLTRYACPAPAPIPVSERLPGPEDCDAKGKCWAIGTLGMWIRVAKHKVGPGWIAWLPYWALPLPTSSNGDDQ